MVLNLYFLGLLFTTTCKWSMYGTIGCSSYWKNRLFLQYNIIIDKNADLQTIIDKWREIRSEKKIFNDELHSVVVYTGCEDIDHYRKIKKNKNKTLTVYLSNDIMKFLILYSVEYFLEYVGFSHPIAL